MPGRLCAHKTPSLPQMNLTHIPLLSGPVVRRVEQGLTTSRFVFAK